METNKLIKFKSKEQIVTSINRTSKEYLEFEDFVKKEEIIEEKKEKKNNLKLKEVYRVIQLLYPIFEDEFGKLE
jgi:hypothetical protein